MDAPTLAARLDQVQVVDVRDAGDWYAGHVDGAIHLPDDELPVRADELDRTRPVIAVCRSGARSADAAEWLRGQGFDAESLDGGMLAWKWAGLAITAPAPVPEPELELGSQEMQAMHDEFLAIGLALAERFGDGVEPSEEELHAFLRERLIGEGRTPEEADTFLADMGGD